MLEQRKTHKSYEAFMIAFLTGKAHGCLQAPSTDRKGSLVDMEDNVTPIILYGTNSTIVRILLIKIASSFGNHNIASGPCA